MFILETKFPLNKEQKIYNILRVPDPGSHGWNRHATMVNCFFHRHARDRIRYNVTNLRQFTRHDEFERKYYDWDWLTYEDVDDLDAFFKMIGFNYRQKSWLDPNEKSRKVK